MSDKPFYRQYRIAWSDIDANRHLANTAYSRLATNVRVEFLAENGLDMKKFEKIHVGPVLLAEKIFYFREAGYNELVTVDLELGGLSPDYDFFRFFQHVYLENGKLSARLELDITWLDLKTRKLYKPDEEFKKIMSALRKAADFQSLPGNGPGIRPPRRKKSPALLSRSAGSEE